MSSGLRFNTSLTWADRTVLTILEDDIASWSSAATKGAAMGPPIGQGGKASKCTSTRKSTSSAGVQKVRDGEKTDQLRAANNPQHRNFEPSVFSSVDLRDLTLPAMADKLVLQPYISWARKIMRVETDVIMLTHLLTYTLTTVPSALVLFYHFTYEHALLHVAMQFYYTGSYTLMMHQHIHQRGILARRFGLLDHVFPYFLDPMMGHTWNAYYYHHVKHHHVEGNGPDDLSSTLRYQRDSIWDFVCYVARFYLLVWLDLPLYFLRKSQPAFALRAGASEFMTYIFYYVAMRFNAQAAFFVYLLPLMLLRVGLMVGNWGQHAFVDPDQPGSSFRSSITVIDVASNRFSYNDGYHTSHHLNPLRHWREHPVSFLEQKETYIKEGALVLHNIDYLMITVRLLMKDYEALAKCLVPMGDQISLTMDGRMELLKKLTTKFTAEQIREKYSICASRHPSDMK